MVAVFGPGDGFGDVGIPVAVGPVVVDVQFLLRLLDAMYGARQVRASVMWPIFATRGARAV